MKFLTFSAVSKKPDYHALFFWKQHSTLWNLYRQQPQLNLKCRRPMYTFINSWWINIDAPKPYFNFSKQKILTLPKSKKRHSQIRSPKRTKMLMIIMMWTNLSKHLQSHSHRKFHQCNIFWRSSYFPLVFQFYQSKCTQLVPSPHLLLCCHI